MKILFRPDRNNEEELAIASRYCDVVTCRSEIKSAELVIGRYSVLPYYAELEKDLWSNNAWLINGYIQHRYIANMQWASDLKGLTPDTYNDNNFHMAPEGPYVVKGETNSKKLQWDTKMFGVSKKDALRIASDLVDDGGLLGQQMVYRNYMPLKRFGEAMNGLPITNEWRFFVFQGKILTYGYYWDEFADQEVIDKAHIDKSGFDLVNKTIKIVSPHAAFFVVDVGQKEDGDWIVIEINDGQMSGLTGCDPHALYKGLQNE